MRKSIFVILAFIMVSLAFWGLKTDIIEKVSGITLSLNNSQINIDHPVLEIEIENSSNYEVTYGSLWKIERYVNGRWRKVYPTGLVISSNTILYVVDPYHSNKETIDLKPYLEGKLVVGKYRIIKEIEIEQATYRLGATFEME